MAEVRAQHGPQPQGLKHSGFLQESVMGLGTGRREGPTLSPAHLAALGLNLRMQVPSQGPPCPLGRLPPWALSFLTNKTAPSLSKKSSFSEQEKLALIFKTVVSVFGLKSNEQTVPRKKKYIYI